MAKNIWSNLYLSPDQPRDSWRPTMVGRNHAAASGHYLATEAAMRILDRGGNTIYTNQIVVGGENADGLTIIRGQGAYSYSCVDKCRATPMVGDAPEHFSSTMSTITGKNRTAKGE